VVALASCLLCPYLFR